MAALGPPAAARPARAEDMDVVYRMGYDVWGEGLPVARYLADCRSSAKYAVGRWYVLDAAGRPASSLVVYRDRFGLPPGAWGLGSLATPPALRGRGLAAALVDGVLALEPGPAFLFADIGPAYYRRFGFVALPPAFQLRPGTTLMARGAPPELRAPPSYF